MSLESKLAGLEEQIGGVQKLATSLANALQRLKRAAGTGHLSEIDSAMSAVCRHSEEVNSAVTALPDAWRFDAKGYLADAYAMELLEEAKAQGLNLVERDGRLYCFPLTIRLDAAEGVARIGKKREKRLRPGFLVRQLAAMQRSRPRFNAQKFLETLYQVYQRVQGERWQRVESGPGPAMPLIEIYSLLTLLPGSDYPEEEFGRDLLLLAREPDLRTRDGHSFQFVGSTMARERIRRFNVYDESGMERVFIALAFAKGA